MAIADLIRKRRVVIKIGSALITNDGAGLDRAAIQNWVEQIAQLLKTGREIVLVSSGAVAEGMSRLGWASRPQELHALQAAAAVGQMGLVQAWESAFSTHDLHTAQVLLTHDDLSDRRRYLNARSTLCTLMGLGVIPIINENDTVTFEELQLGDNDNLAALVANLIEADLLVILTDQDGLYDKDPRAHADASLVERARVDDPALEAMAGEGKGRLGRGGMRTKLQAARRAGRSGTTTLIASGRRPGVVADIAKGWPIGTVIRPSQEPIAARKRWLAGQLQVRGTLVLDAGAVEVLKAKGRSLLPVGVTAVRGDFQRGDLVACVDAAGNEVARGLVNYPAGDAAKLCGQPSDQIEQRLGYVDESELIHRDNLVLV